MYKILLHMPFFSELLVYEILDLGLHCLLMLFFLRTLMYKILLHMPFFRNFWCMKF